MNPKLRISEFVLLSLTRQLYNRFHRVAMATLEADGASEDIVRVLRYVRVQDERVYVTCDDHLTLGFVSFRAIVTKLRLRSLTRVISSQVMQP